MIEREKQPAMEKEMSRGGTGNNNREEKYR
jgi:hypothetical protein